MQRLLNFLPLIVLFSPLAHAQLDSVKVNQAAFNLTKATVEFVATDAKTYGNRKTTTCETCNDYPSLIQFINANKLTKADQLVRDAQAQTRKLMIPTATADQVLTGLQRFLHDRVTTGDKSGRLNLPSYKVYTGQITQILSSAGVDAAPEPQEVAAVPADTVDTGEPAMPVASVNKAEAGGIFSYGGLALVLSVLNLLGLAYLWLVKGSKSQSASLSDTQLPELSRRVVTLETERKDLLNRMTRLERGALGASERSAPAPEPRRNESVAPKPAPAVPAPEPVRQTQTAPSAAPIQPPVPAPRPTQPAPVPTPQPSFQSQPQPAPAMPANQPRRREVVLYGRTADLGDGFSVGSLLETPDRDTVFQIEVRTDSQAVYRVTEEPGAQQLALSDPYSYLADACEYMAKPMPNARIRTNQPGQLALQGDKWKILEKAKISFY